MTEFKVIPGCDNTGDTFDTRGDAQEARTTHADLCPDCNPGDIEIDDGTDEIEDVEVVETTPTEESPPEMSEDGKPQETRATHPETFDNEVPDEKNVEQDPVDWLPSHFIDQIQGVPTVNRKGYAVLCEQYGVSVTAEPVTLPSDTDFEYAEFRATATTEDGQEYSGFGSAHVERQDGDDAHLLAELAETRALKRAAAWATGVGVTAIEELKGGRS